MKLKIELDVWPNSMSEIAFALRQVETQLIEKKGEIPDCIRLGLRGRERLLDPDGNTIGFADITD